MKRGTSGLCGVLAIDKPHGMTSHDVVDRVRRITGERRVGHAGTLDPAATGLMLVGVGAATRLSDYLIGHDKEYDARIVFGVATDTDDAEGRVLTSRPAELSRADCAEALARFTGSLDQLPPAYSAIKKNGVTAYKAAREGKSIELEQRRVTVYEARLVGEGAQTVDLNDGAGGRLVRDLPFWDVHFRVSKGTYIRALARDIGVYLGTGAHLGALRRTAVADMTIDQACTLEELAARVSAGQQPAWCDPACLLGFPVVELDEQQVKSVENGRTLDDIEIAAGDMVSCVHEKKLLAVYSYAAGALKPATVIPGGAVGVG